MIWANHIGGPGGMQWPWSSLSAGVRGRFACRRGGPCSGSRIEAAILLRFVVNAIHFYPFTYPRLA